jgi:DNA-binding IclR family transcriptional regulator
MIVHSGLAPEHEAVLAVYERLRIRAGFGLTLRTLAHELGGRPDDETRRTLDRMVRLGLLQVLPEVGDYYLLTRDGETLFNPLA